MNGKKSCCAVVSGASCAARSGRAPLISAAESHCGCHPENSFKILPGIFRFRKIRRHPVGHLCDCLVAAANSPIGADYPGFWQIRIAGLSVEHWVNDALMGLCRLPDDLDWRHVLGAGILGGIGFTMSIFITNLAFAGDAATINDLKMTVLLTSLTAGAVGFLWLKWVCRSGSVAGNPGATGLR